MQRIRDNYAVSVKRGSLAQEEMDKRLALIEPVDDLRGDRRLRRGHRGGVRADAGEEGGVRQARRGHEARRAAVLQHVRSRYRRDRQRDEAARRRRGHAFLRSCQRHEDVRGGQRRQDVAGDAGGGHEARPRHRQDQRLRRQLRRLRRQPHTHPLQPRAGVDGGGGRAARAGRQGDGRLRLSGRAVRGQRHVGARHQLRHTQAPRRRRSQLPRTADHRPPGRDGPARPEDRQGLVPLREGRPHAHRRPRGARTSSSRSPPRGASSSAPSPTRRSCAACCSPRSTRPARSWRRARRCAPATST